MITTKTRYLGIALVFSLQLTASALASECPLFDLGVETGAVKHTALKEISGMAASRQNSGVLWVHNDSGDTPRVFALRPDGTHLGIYTLDGAGAKDWEDMAIGPGPLAGVDYLYLADTGDNSRNRSSITVYRVPEPAVSATQSPVHVTLSGVEALGMQYPGQRYDCETLLVDPVSGDLFLVTRDRIGEGYAHVFTYPAASQNPGVMFTLEWVTSFLWPYEFKAGDISSDGAWVILRAHSFNVPVDALLWNRIPGEPLENVFSREPCLVPVVFEPQGEAIAFAPDGQGYYTTSEGTTPPIYFYEKVPPPPTTPPSAPSDLNASAISSRQVDLEWIDQSSDESGFSVERSSESGPFEEIALLEANRSSYSDVTVSELRTYHYRVRAFNAAGVSPYSDPVSVTTPQAPPIPPAPTDLTASAWSDSEIFLAWQDNAENEDGFQVERSEDRTAWITLLPLISADVTAVIDTALQPGKTYFYRVRAYNDGGFSEPSNEAAAAPFVDSVAESDLSGSGSVRGSYQDTHASDGRYQQISEVSSGGKPSTRTSFLEHKWRFTVTPGHKITFFLQAHQTQSSDKDNFQFAYATDDLTYHDLELVSATSPPDTSLAINLPNTLNGTVYVRVRDTDRTPGNSALDTLYVDHMLIRTEVSVITSAPAAPILQEPMVGDQIVALSWTPVPGASTYVLWRRGADGEYTVPPAATLTDTTYLDHDVVNGVTYHYVVTGVNSYGQSEPSNEISATPALAVPPLPPSDLSATPGKKRVNLTWAQSPNSGVTQNSVYRSTDNEFFELVATRSATTSYSDTGLRSGVTYFYYVTAISPEGESEPSNVAGAAAK